jgi:sulfonate dioxygenase
MNLCDTGLNTRERYRKHPVTGQKALYVNPGFTRHIVGLKKEESDTILNLL